jgi:hypothetical protein
MVMSPAGLGPTSDCAGENQQQFQTKDPSSRQRGCYIRAITASVQLKKILVLGSQGAWRQDELTDGKPPVIK